MNDRPTSNDRLPEDEPTVQTTVTQEPNYDVFGLWMDSELEKLIARWVHLAAPNASRPFRRRFAK